ncbi:hypothetical protein FYJ34_03745 [Clostridiaceae bacterium 68-1-5]|uniref:Uncharacterized protein n=2 Tax=Suipraeoptans intestinalis TaxID=2606628 RepID=A0A6N7USB8_9FIRM|nr:hypothetical protein [Suipraeoptans intestinalis]
MGERYDNGGVFSGDGPYAGKYGKACIYILIVRKAKEQAIPPVFLFHRTKFRMNGFVHQHILSHFPKQKGLCQNHTAVFFEKRLLCKHARNKILRRKEEMNEKNHARTGLKNYKKEQEISGKERKDRRSYREKQGKTVHCCTKKGVDDAQEDMLSFGHIVSCK